MQVIIEESKYQKVTLPKCHDFNGLENGRDLKSLENSPSMPTSCSFVNQGTVFAEIDANKKTKGTGTTTTDRIIVPVTVRRFLAATTRKLITRTTGTVFLGRVGTVATFTADIQNVWEFLQNKVMYECVKVSSSRRRISQIAMHQTEGHHCTVTEDLDNRTANRYKLFGRLSTYLMRPLWRLQFSTVLLMTLIVFTQLQLGESRNMLENML